MSVMTVTLAAATGYGAPVGITLTVLLFLTGLSASTLRGYARFSVFIAGAGPAEPFRVKMMLRHDY